MLSDFRRGTGEGPAYGEAARLACEGTKNAATAYLDMAREMGAEVDFAVYASAVPSGVVTLRIKRQDTMPPSPSPNRIKASKI